MHAKHPCFASKASVVTASKIYKKIFFYICKHKKDAQNKLKVEIAKKENKDISINDLYTLFKDNSTKIYSHDSNS